MYSRFIKASSSSSFFLFGPRGTGKSFWVREKFKNAVFVDLLDDATYRELLAKPEMLAQRIPPKPGSWVVIDEVQKVPALLDEAHRQIELNKIKFVLTGSSARKLKRSGVNLLAGRALTHAAYPLTVRELGVKFSLAKQLQRGFLPAVIEHPEPDSFLNSYVNTYLKEEVQQEGLVRNLSNFARFLEVASFSQASILNMTAVARDCAIERKVVENYFQILEDLLIAERVPVFQKRAKRKMVTHPKFFYFDVGVYRTLRPRGPLDQPSEIGGVALETFVFQELRALNHYKNWNFGIYTWRTQSHAEVDFVLYGEKGIFALEIKGSTRIRSEDLKGLNFFLEDYPNAKAYFLYLGKEKRFIEGIQAIPILDFIYHIHDYL